MSVKKHVYVPVRAVEIEHNRTENHNSPLQDKTEKREKLQAIILYFFSLAHTQVMSYALVF